MQICNTSQTANGNKQQPQQHPASNIKSSNINHIQRTANSKPIEYYCFVTIVLIRILPLLFICKKKKKNFVLYYTYTSFIISACAWQKYYLLNQMRNGKKSGSWRLTVDALMGSQLIACSKMHHIPYFWFYFLSFRFFFRFCCLLFNPEMRRWYCGWNALLQCNAMHIHM